jgi:hypothetical protein
MKKSIGITLFVAVCIPSAGAGIDTADLDTFVRNAMATYGVPGADALRRALRL